VEGTDFSDLGRQTCTPPPPVILRSKLKIGERYCDERRDDEQDGEDNAQNPIKGVGLIDSPNCNGE
jgi:hypothetical protein